MTSTLAPPPPPAFVTPPAPGGRRAARRAISRWAWRLLRREWRQQFLVLTLLAVAVAATTVGLGLVVNVQSSDEALTGTANTRIDIANPGQQVSADIAAARQAFGTVEAIEHENIPVPGSVNPVGLRAQDPHGVYGAPMLRLVSGSYPSGAGQVAMTSAVAATFRLAIGDSWPVNGRTLRVVGIVENPKNLQDAFALVAPGQISSPSSLTLLMDSSGSVAGRFHPPSGAALGIMTTGATAAQQQRNEALAVLLIATIGLTFIGLLAVAGFTVIAQRRLRALGMIGAIGATDRQVRRVLLANGAAVGTVGATAGALAGLAVWFALRPAFEHLVGHRIDPFKIPWWAVVAGAALAILTALAASWWPARSAARMPIVAALSGRPAPPKPAHRFALLGAVLAAAGFVLLVLAHAHHAVLIVTGILAITAGMLLLAPLGVRALAATARRAPVAVRLALRDLARYQARSGAALAATSLAVGIAATIAISAAAEQAADHSLSAGNLPTNQLIVWLSGNPNDAGGGPNAVVAAGNGSGAAAGPSPAAIATARSTATSIGQSLNAQHVVELDVAANPQSVAVAGAPPDARWANLAYPVTENGQKGFTLIATPFVATPTVLDFYRIPSNVIEPGTDVLTARPDLSGRPVDAGGIGRSFQPVTVQVTKLLPNYTSAPNTLLTEKAVTALGLTPQPVGWLLQTHQPLTAGQISDARHRAADAGITIETRTASDNSAQQLRDYSTIAGMLLALAVLAMTVGLIRSETAGDLRTLTATGASSSTRRTLTAATAAALALLGGILGTAGAYVALIAWHWHDLSYLSHPPYLNLAALVFGLPTVALVGGWLFGRTPVAISRRALE
jgi:putative ABC transport system permease protein